METLIYRLFFQNWQRKLVALITAIIIWVFVNHSIIETKVIPSVPIRVINLPADKTIIGLLPNGILSKRITLTLSGTKDVISQIEPGDVEILFDASTVDRDDWVLQVSKKNLVSLNPSIDLAHHITQVSHTEYIIKMSRLVTAKIPVTILPPTGQAPSGYEFLDIWPQTMMQTISGAEQDIQNLKSKGLELTFDLNEISKAELDAIKSTHSGNHNDEISFFVPAQWKDIPITFHNNALEELNDPEAQNLRINFLRKEYLPVEKEIEISVFYPLKNIDVVNPETLLLTSTDSIQKRNGIAVLSRQLYIYEVSRLFLDIIRDNMRIVIMAAPKNERDHLQWSLEIVNPSQLEDTYVAFLRTNSNTDKNKEVMLRKRFRDYMQKMSLYSSPGHKLNLDSHIEGNLIKVNINKN